MADGSRFFPAPRLILAALVAGALAGAVAVYVSESRSGNNAPAQAAVGDSRDDVTCAAKSDRAKKVAASATGEVAALLPADPPQSMKSLAFNGPDGKPMTLADHAGKTVLLNLWATWCAPCRAEMPALDALQKEKGSDSFEVVAVNVDAGDDVKPKKFLSDTGVATLGYYRDSTMTLFNDLKKRGLALGLPVTMLIDGEGCLIAHMNGPAEWSGPDARRLVETALKPESL
ncbi:MULTISPECIES: TlpA disulfide reductase family protein [unclassified Mesorhizobium]|jgi:thiol-disulfide isomerase/thioredoxin|uniref:thiol:disulfide interchange protein TlpA n=2 Tax=Mesorhizobium TaxID=68287 RepID=UPI000FCCCAFA|nr:MULTISPECIES: TlpA disulfide reductase family protein [unclassified Mesorhizobium]AZV19928.1 TlpA family protein disulfide reductase [Mesorhizobium sp. M7A.F.Ce.TU.012.03.2.1]RUU87483.1 TlpA family protein disulfide reductase [Mesorhizobium sp. M7A.F.Ca.MR.176.00.0.0]RVD14882.1 TlpA family protein disulfide reductase [Mesorhizobium sp. M7A.F.Ca.ET.027.02.1.1]RVD65722.1 TlpA family protein disulfide reductase [Mesorhizobium sp. M7A.F.Ca.ET.027.03.2.1]RWD08277.1 MAG: TlpA family protein disul